eukprot:TRINITY_DN803_c0_g1_i2.p1 TRINITY_DN803_c0_g1~~TRINITY_DN803_c0_g1_i2.p1  ORF type:complete len:285 (-),score=33.72 TRINITY_DN803_c0_g1_i2:743-1597(-)
MRIQSLHVVHRIGTSVRSYLRARSLSSLAASHSSWFKIPEEGMKDFELLARGSSFFVPGPNTGALIALTSAHVSAPHRYENYFPHEWLRHVQDGNCRSLIETRSENGKEVNTTICNVPLPSGFRHFSLDVAAFVLDERSEELIRSQNISVMKIDDAEPEVGTEVTIGGFRLLGESGSGTEAVMEAPLDGKVSEIVHSRMFVNTGDTVSEMGMCGGPVVLKDSPNICLGILEGLVPQVEEGQDAGEMHRRVAGHSVIITARELQMFLHDIETEVGRSSKTEQEKK